ncbi:hypothetical protein BD410DRAFT_817279 [Rickenella mellea]|uniref:CxC2-like cysteine cluster KDZ transposase-associated domain-containing protein n=1 Tax=Rickenella mellea TaxID=50990 RepID=A0A4Y7PFP4_9AGAM|nr:hypothetical protein BD410DRAFT_817279 [Rickenella mellea]
MYLEELLRHEARLTHTGEDLCDGCRSPEPNFRCRECFGDRLVCGACMVADHKTHPFHRPERWTGTHFERTNLKHLGLKLQLGHREGDLCVNPDKGSASFVVIHTNGIHEVAINFCGCATAKLHTIQLLRARLFPATTSAPKTAATFELLKNFHISTFESKASSWHFYSALRRQSDNTGLTDVKLRYEAFRCMVREYSYIELLKRAGRGHSPDPVSATAPGECAVQCPACPHPGINLPPGWRDADPERRWLYTLILAMDANFRLKRRKASSINFDPGLGTGLAYFVEDEPFRTHIADYVDQREMSSCSGFAAVADANTRSAKGLSSTGVGALVCARHGLMRPTSACDLQKGEKYANMDYIFWSALHGSRPHRIVISYDIACQWSVNLWSRVMHIPRLLRLSPQEIDLIEKVPNFHLLGHASKCHIIQSLHYLKGGGMTDGEAIERGWAGTNPLANSTKEMGPGARHDALDDHWGDMNWKKIVGMGASLLRKMKLAIPGRTKHETEFQILTASLTTASVVKWTAMIVAWEADHEQDNPYEPQMRLMTQVDVRLAFARQEAVLLDSGVSYLHEKSPNVVISTGVDLELQQRRLRFDVASTGASATSLQLTKLLERRNVLRRKIDAWMESHVVYLPCVTQLRLDAAREQTVLEEAEDIKLWLPSQIPPTSRGDGTAVHLEWQLRLAQARDSLDDLRHNLHLRSFLAYDKYKNVRGIRPNTRSNGLITRANEKVKAAADTYSIARLALTSLGLGPDGATWENIVLPLRPVDIRPITEGLDGESEGQRSISWIWKVEGVAQGMHGDGEDDPNLQDTLRVEWAKARARALRYGEEVDLLTEEMRRTLQWLLARSDFWTTRSLPAMWSDKVTSVQSQNGLIAYAHRQAAIYLGLGAQFAKMWKSVPRDIQAGLRDIQAALISEEDVIAPAPAVVDAAPAPTDPDND